MLQFIIHLQNIGESARNSSPNKYNSSLNPSKNIDKHGKKASLEEDSIKIIGTRPPISCHVSPIGQSILILNKNQFSVKRPENNQQNCRQHNSSYYQPQPEV